MIDSQIIIKGNGDILPVKSISLHNLEKGVFNGTF